MNDRVMIVGGGSAATALSSALRRSGTTVIAASAAYPDALADSLSHLSDVTGPSPIKAAERAAAVAAKPAPPFRKFTDTRKAEKMHKRLRKMLKRGDL